MGCCDAQLKWNNIKYNCSGTCEKTVCGNCIKDDVCYNCKTYNGESVKWDLDKNFPSCSTITCGKVFGLTTRKRHCRGCGHIFCRGCCNADKVCESCVNASTRRRSSTEPSHSKPVGWAATVYRYGQLGSSSGSGELTLNQEISKEPLTRPKRHSVGATVGGAQRSSTVTIDIKRLKNRSLTKPSRVSTPATPSTVDQSTHTGAGETTLDLPTAPAMKGGDIVMLHGLTKGSLNGLIGALFNFAPNHRTRSGVAARWMVLLDLDDTACTDAPFTGYGLVPVKPINLRKLDIPANAHLNLPPHWLLAKVDMVQGSSTKFYYYNLVTKKRSCEKPIMAVRLRNQSNSP